MGLGPNWTVSTHEEPLKLPNPDPTKFEIRNSHFINDLVILEVLYPGCTNYEGRKVLVFKKDVYDKLIAKSPVVMDPHFTDKGFAPIARFAPTQEGWDNGIIFMKNYKA